MSEFLDKYPELKKFKEELAHWHTVSRDPYQCAVLHKVLSDFNKAVEQIDKQNSNIQPAEQYYHHLCCSASRQFPIGESLGCCCKSLFEKEIRSRMI